MNQAKHVCYNVGDISLIARDSLSTLSAFISSTLSIDLLSRSKLATKAPVESFADKLQIVINAILNG